MTEHAESLNVAPGTLVERLVPLTSPAAVLRELANEEVPAGATIRMETLHRAFRELANAIDSAQSRDESSRRAALRRMTQDVEADGLYEEGTGFVDTRQNCSAYRPAVVQETACAGRDDNDEGQEDE